MLAGRFGAGHPGGLRGSRRGHQRRGARSAAESARRGRGLVSAAAGGPVGARMRQLLEARGIRKETSELLGLGCAPSTRDGLKSYLLDRKFELSLLLRSGLVVQRDNGDVVDRFRGPADDPHLPGQRVGDRVWRAGDRAGPGAEVPELAGNADLLEEPDAVRAAPGQTGHPEARTGDPCRGLLRRRAAGAGRASRRLLPRAARR